MKASPLDLAPFLRPKSVAIVGASTDPASISARPARYLSRLGFDGEVTLVNRAATSILGHPAVTSLTELERAPDVALLLVPADGVLPALRQCAEIGTSAAIAIASGFEGSAGAARRAEVLSFLAEHPAIRLVGPNGNGVLSVPSRAALCFSSVLLDEDPLEGRVSLVTQSGAIGNGLFLALQRRGVGLAHWFSTGDELSVGAMELTAALLHEDTRAVGVFVEGLTDAAFLPDVAAAIEQTGKPVVALRAPQSDSSRAAAYAHTGRLIGDDFIGREAMRQHGIHLVDDMAELADVLSVLSVLPPPAPVTERAGPVRVGVLTVSGGLGVFAAEAVSREPGLALATLDAPVIDSLREVLPSHLPIANPLDVPVLGNTGVFAGALGALQVAACCDVVLVVATTLAHDYETLAAAVDPRGHPVVIAHLSPEERFSPAQMRALVERGGVSVPSVTSAAAGLGVGAAGRRPADAAPRGPHTTGRQLGILATADLLSPALEPRMPLARAVSSLDEVQSVTRTWGGSFTLKAEGSAIAHRTELGAVAVGLDPADEVNVAAAYDRVAAACAEHGDRVVVQQMCAAGVEVLLSVVRDQELGPVPLVRAGGVFVELLGETVALTGPRATWPALVAASSSIGPLLGGFRGAPPSDVAALLELAHDLREAVRGRPEIAVVECNPVIVHRQGEGVSVVDAMTVTTR